MWYIIKIETVYEQFLRFSFSFLDDYIIITLSHSLLLSLLSLLLSHTSHNFLSILFFPLYIFTHKLKMNIVDVLVNRKTLNKRQLIMFRWWTLGFLLSRFQSRQLEDIFSIKWGNEKKIIFQLACTKTCMTWSMRNNRMSILWFL